MLAFLEGIPTAENVINVKLNSDPLVPSVGQGMIVDFQMTRDVLMSNDVCFLTDEVGCGDIWGGVWPIWGGIFFSDSMMCTKRSHGQGTCKGDSGRPLVIKGHDGAADLQVEVVSFVPDSGCASDLPDACARVSHAYLWIQCEADMRPGPGLIAAPFPPLLTC